MHISELFDQLEDAGVEVEMTLDRLMGDEELYVEYLLQLPENENIKILRRAVDEKDDKTAMDEVHTLKGVALNLGLLPLVDACMSMLLDYRADNALGARDQITEVEDTFEEINRIIISFREEQ